MGMKHTGAILVFVAVIAFMAAPAHAQDAGPVVDDPSPEEVDADSDEADWDEDSDGLGKVRAAAVHARNTARKLAKADQDAGGDSDAGSNSDGDDPDLDKASEALDAALERLAGGAGGNGVAAQVLMALLAGYSPSEIGSRPGPAMASAAAEGRTERETARPEAGHGRTDYAGKPGSSDTTGTDSTDMTDSDTADTDASDADGDTPDHDTPDDDTDKTRPGNRGRGNNGHGGRP